MIGAGQVRVYQNNNFYSMPWTQIGQDIKGKIIQIANPVAWTNESLGRSLALSTDGSVLAVGVPYANGKTKSREGNVRISICFRSMDSNRR